MGLRAFDASGSLGNKSKDGVVIADSVVVSSWSVFIPRSVVTAIVMI